LEAPPNGSAYVTVASPGGPLQGAAEGAVIFAAAPALSRLIFSDRSGRRLNQPESVIWISAMNKHADLS
jgi:hypothetical protein